MPTPREDSAGAAACPGPAVAAAVASAGRRRAAAGRGFTRESDADGHWQRGSHTRRFSTSAAQTAARPPRRPGAPIARRPPAPPVSRRTATLRLHSLQPPTPPARPPASRPRCPHRPSRSTSSRPLSPAPRCANCAGPAERSRFSCTRPDCVTAVSRLSTRRLCGGLARRPPVPGTLTIGKRDSARRRIEARSERALGAGGRAKRCVSLPHALLRWSTRRTAGGHGDEAGDAAGSPATANAHPQSPAITCSGAGAPHCGRDATCSPARPRPPSRLFSLLLARVLPAVALSCVRLTLIVP